MYKYGAILSVYFDDRTVDELEGIMRQCGCQNRSEMLRRLVHERFKNIKGADIANK